MQVLTKLSMESAKTVLFRTKLTMLPLSAACDEGLVYQRHQFGQSSRCVEAGNEKRWNTKRTQSTVAEAAIKEIESFSEFLPNVPDTNARTLAL